MDRESVTLTVPRWSKRRRTLVGIDMFVTATAIAGGVLLVTGREDERFPREILARTPFDNFTVPGWLLGAGVGGSAAISTIAASASPHGTPCIGPRWGDHDGLDHRRSGPCSPAPSHRD